MKKQFFRDCSNIFDAILVVLGGVGIWLGFQELTETASSNSSLSATTEVGSQSRLIRVARIFRVLRLVRLVRLYRLYVTIKANLQHKGISFELADHLRRIALLEAFVKAQVESQEALMGYFCTKDVITSPELARVIIQSQTNVFEATKNLHLEEQHVGKRTLRAVKTLRESVEATREVEKFVISAHKVGILGSVETESLLHPVHEHLAHVNSQISRVFEGWTGDLDEERPPPASFRTSVMSFLATKSTKSLRGAQETPIAQESRIEEDPEGSDDEDEAESRTCVQDICTLPPDYVSSKAADQSSSDSTRADQSHVGPRDGSLQGILPGTLHT